MKHVIIFIIGIMPILTYGQSFYLVESYPLQDYEPYRIHKYALPFEEFEHHMVFEYKDSTILWNPLTDTYHKRKGKLDEMNASLKEGRLYILKDDRTYLFKTKGRRLLPVLGRAIPNKYRKRYITVNQSFYDSEFIYHIAFYNNFNASNGHDHMYVFKCKNTKVFQVEDYDLGKEVLLGPWGFQNATLYEDKIVVASAIKNELYLISTDDLKVQDTILIDPLIKEENITSLDQAFPDKTVSYFMHKPKDAIDQALKFGVLDRPLIRKLVMLNDSLLIITRGVKDGVEHEVIIFNMKSRQQSSSKTYGFKGNGVWSHLAYSDRIYVNALGQLKMVSEIDITDTSTCFLYSVYAYTMEPELDLDLHFQDSLRYHDQRIVELNKFKAVILADESFCSGCYDKLGIGRELLVIKATRAATSAALFEEYKRYKHSWKINGDLLLVSPEEFEAMVKNNKVNVPLPIH